MPERIVRPGILTSDSVCSLSWAAEVFYRRLMSAVDDYGRFDGRLPILRAQLYPLQLEKVSDSDIGKWRLETAKAGLVRVYAVEGKDYVQIEKFDQRVQGKPKWPEPPANSQESTVTHRESPEITETNREKPLSSETYSKSETKTEARKRAKAAAPPLTHLPDGFAVSDRVQRWAAEKGHDRLLDRFEHFCSTAKARAYVYADWDEAFMKAVREDWAKLNGKPGNGLYGGNLPKPEAPNLNQGELY